MTSANIFRKAVQLVCLVFIKESNQRLLTEEDLHKSMVYRGCLHSYFMCSHWKDSFPASLTQKEVCDKYQEKSVAWWIYILWSNELTRNLLIKWARSSFFICLNGLNQRWVHFTQCVFFYKCILHLFKSLLWHLKYNVLQAFWCLPSPTSFIHQPLGWSQ